MPIYDYECIRCKKGLELYKPISKSQESERCEDCGEKAERVFGFHKDKEFFSFYDEQYGCEISSRRQEEKLMRKNGHIFTRDTPQVEKFKEDIKRKQKRRIYSFG